VTRSIRAQSACSAFDLVFSDDFSGPALDRDRWIDHYLPTGARPNAQQPATSSAAMAWGCSSRPTNSSGAPRDGPMRVSNIQTGSFSGPLGARVLVRNGPS
jgi:hypothetical protein